MIGLADVRPDGMNASWFGMVAAGMSILGGGMRYHSNLLESLNEWRFRMSAEATGIYLDANKGIDFE